MMRTIVDIPDEVGPQLAAIAQAEGCSKAAIVREAIQNYLNARAPETNDEAFGLWKKNAVDGVKYQNKLRSEWN